MSQSAGFIVKRVLELNIKVRHASNDVEERGSACW